MFHLHIHQLSLRISYAVACDSASSVPSHISYVCNDASCSVTLRNNNHNERSQILARYRFISLLQFSHTMSSETRCTSLGSPLLSTHFADATSCVRMACLFSVWLLCRVAISTRHVSAAICDVGDLRTPSCIMDVCTYSLYGACDVEVLTLPPSRNATTPQQSLRVTSPSQRHVISGSHSYFGLLYLHVPRLPDAALERPDSPSSSHINITRSPRSQL